MLEFTPPSGAVFFGFIGEYTYRCNYKAVTSTSDEIYEVTVRETECSSDQDYGPDSGSCTEAEAFVTWDGGMHLNFFEDSLGFTFLMIILFIIFFQNLFGII